MVYLGSNTYMMLVVFDLQLLGALWGNDNRCWHVGKSKRRGRQGRACGVGGQRPRQTEQKSGVRGVA